MLIIYFILITIIIGIIGMFDRIDIIWNIIFFFRKKYIINRYIDIIYRLLFYYKKECIIDISGLGNNHIDNSRWSIESTEKNNIKPDKQIWKKYTLTMNQFHILHKESRKLIGIKKYDEDINTATYELNTFLLNEKNIFNSFKVLIYNTFNFPNFYLKRNRILSIIKFMEVRGLIYCSRINPNDNNIKYYSITEKFLNISNNGSTWNNEKNDINFIKDIISTIK